MRLIHTETLELAEFFDSQIPKYAILSHRWGEKEISYKEFCKGAAPEGLGLTKIRNFCALAAARGHQWGWIDTCCIDKRSSAELSEAINSMFNWYAKSEECLVHLADVECSEIELRSIPIIYKHFPDQIVIDLERNEDLECSELSGWDSLKDSFCKSCWFSRGWTLQELLAPENVVFFDAGWYEIGHRFWLAPIISEAARINVRFVEDGLVKGDPASVAQKMSWVSRRETSRSEDIAYCLLGLFGVNMPLLYGEGAEKAFLRLQIEIVKFDDDESIFAWKSDQEFSTSLLATHPSFFYDSGSVIRHYDRTFERPPFSWTNNGLEIAVPKGHIHCPTFSMMLDCTLEGSGSPLTIQLWRPIEDSSIAYRTRLSELTPFLEPGQGYAFTASLYRHIYKDFRKCKYLYISHHGFK
ncbi:MAG: hypothetical protein LQ351_007410 [Letrouitia transgressa]|nr:MAG: hypothetical protein LQ351_007410 [Letrouitia transgressa]